MLDGCKKKKREDQYEAEVLLLEEQVWARWCSSYKCWIGQGGGEVEVEVWKGGGLKWEGGNEGEWEVEMAD